MVAVFEDHDVDWLLSPAWHDQERAWAQSDLISFIRRMSPKYQPAWFHFRIADRLQAVMRGEIDRMMIIMPPRHGKSTLCSRYFPAFYLGQFPDNRIIATSYSDRLAHRFGRFTRNVIQDLTYPFDLHLARDSHAAEQFDVAGQSGGYLAAGVGGTMTGEGADLLLIDDAVKNAEEADSEAFRERVIEWYSETAYPRLEADGAVVMIGTRWRDDDLIGYVLSQQAQGGDQWEVLHLPAINDAGEALWPERYSIPRLMRRKANMTSRMWEAQYQGQPIPAEGGMFQRKWWQRYTNLPKLTKLELYLDSAFKEGVANDYSVYALWGTDGQGSAFLIRVWRRRVAFPEMIRLGHDAYAWAQDQFPSLTPTLIIEDKASGQSAIQVFRKPYHTESGVLPKLPVVPFEIKGTQSKVARAEGVTGAVEGQQVFIPARADWLDDWLTEHERFPLGAHDDQVDTTAMALTRMLLKPRKKVEIL